VQKVVKLVIQKLGIQCSKKEGFEYRIVLDFWKINQKSLMDKYTIKDIHKCIGDIGIAESTIFTTHGSDFSFLANTSSLRLGF
jgi:hypothetical protein